jgi:hypothetical protein
MVIADVWLAGTTILLFAAVILSNRYADDVSRARGSGLLSSDLERLDVPSLESMRILHHEAARRWRLVRSPADLPSLEVQRRRVLNVWIAFAATLAGGIILGPALQILLNRGEPLLLALTRTAALGVIILAVGVQAAAIRRQRVGRFRGLMGLVGCVVLLALWLWLVVRS